MTGEVAARPLARRSDSQGPGAGGKFRETGLARSAAARRTANVAKFRVRGLVRHPPLRQNGPRS
jgi:hypothetical protein